MHGLAAFMVVYPTSVYLLQLQTSLCLNGFYSYATRKIYSARHPFQDYLVYIMAQFTEIPLN